MNTKEINKLFCEGCDSEFKVIFNQEDVSGKPKFCPFCSDELFTQEDVLDEFEENGFHDVEEE